MDEKQLQALFNEMKSKLELGDFATFKSQIGSDEKFRKAFYNEASLDLDLGDFNVFNESFKKKVSTTPSAKPAPVSGPAPAPASPSKLPSPSGLTYNDIELVIEDTRKKARRLQDLREAPMASAGIGAPGMVVPKTTLDQAAQELKLAEDKKKEVLTRYQGELSRPVERLIETGEYKSFFTKDGVFDEGKARDYFKKVTQKYGGGSHLQDQWLVNLKTRGQQEIDKPRFNQILGEEMKKNNLDLKQYSTQVFNQLTQEQRTTADSLKKERDAEALKLLNGAEAKAKQYADELNKAVNSLNDQIKAGVITNEEAAATYDQLVKQYETTIKGIDNGYKDAIRKMNVRINGKFDRIEQEVRAINSSIDSDKVMQSLPPDVRKRLETAYQAAGQRLSAEKNEAKKKQEEVTGIGTTDVISRNINLALKSLTSGFNRGLAEVGEYLNMKGLSGSFVDVLRNRRTAAETFAPAQYEWNKDEWLKRAVSSTATSLGASAPILLPTIGAVALTGGGAAGALGAGALSFAGESAQIGGGQFREGLEETGDVVAATKRAEEVMRQNTITAPLYFIGGLGDVMITTGKGLSKVATGIALEQAEEIPTEYIQSFNEAKAKGYNKGIGDFIKENPEIAADTFISTVGQSGAMNGIASAFSVFQKNVPASTTQMLTDAVSKNGVEFTNGLIDKWFEAGKINQKTVAKLKAEVAKIQTQLPKMQEAGVDVEKAKLMSSLSSQSQELQNKINAEKDPAVKALYQNQLNVINQDISQLVKGETPYVVFTLPGGGEMTRVMTVREFNALPAESSNDMVKNSDGIQVVGDDALNTQLTQKKQELGVPEAAPGVFTQAPAAQELSITEAKPAEQIEKKEAIKQKNEFITDTDFVQEAFTPEEDAADREALPESQFKTEEELSNFLETGEYAMLTGQNPEAIPLSKEANRKLNEKAQQWLSSRGLTAVPIFGKYGNSERSFMVPGMTKQQAIDFAKEFQQDSVAHSSGLVYQDGSFNPRKKGVDLSPKFEQGGNFFSTINVGGEKVDFSIEFEDARVQGTKPVAERLRTEIFGDTQQKVASAQKALEKTGVVIQMIEDPNDFDSRVTQLGGQRGMEGVFLSDTGEILINQQKLDQGIADGRVIWHEASHPVVNIVRNTNPQLFGQVVAGLRQAAADNKGVADALAWAESQYAQDGQGVVDDEAVVETIAGIAEGMIDITKLPTGLKQSIIDLINRIARALGFDQVLDDTDIAAFKKLASDIANALTTGQDISEVVGAENVKEYLNTVETPGLVTGGELATAAQARLTTEPAVSVYDSKDVSALPQKSLDEVYNQFGGKAVVINSDPTRVGELTLPSGKKIFMYGGPAYLSIKDNVDANVGFATTQTGKVNTWMKYVKEVFGDNPGVTLVASQAPTSILSNSYALRYVMDAISMLPKSVLRSSDFKNEFFGKDLVLLKDAFGEKAYNEFVNKYKKADLSDPKVIDDMIAEMGYKVGDDNKPASFKARGAFVSNLVGGIADKASLKGVEGDKGYVSKKPNKYIAKQLMDRLGINAEKIMREIGEPSLVDLYMNEGNWGFAVAGFETDPNMTVESVQQGGVKHPLFNAKFPGKNPFILDGAYELNKMFTPVEITGPSGMPYTKTAAQMLAGSMYVKGQPLAEGGSFEYVRTSPSGRRIQERRGNLVADAGLDNKMTSDDQGNYIFYHYSDRKLKAISPSKFGKNLVTGRDERPGIGISMYYTRPDVLEVGVPADYGYAVRVPEQSVYPFNEDPLNLLPAAEQEFNKKFPGQAFDLNKQVAFVTQEAAKRGYPMTVAEWNIKGTKALRAQTTEEFKPEVYRELVPGTTNQYKFNPELDKFKPNRKGRIQASRGNRISTDTQIIDGFYSPIENRINDFKQPKASVTKWKEIVGVKSDEAVFSGMSDWLNSQKPDAQLSKQDVLNFMKDNRIEIKEVEIGDPSEADIEAFMNDEAGEGYTREEAIEYLRGDEGATKYSQYQLPGGENYKEVLITVPNIAEKKYNDYKLQLIGKYGSDFKNKDLTSDEFDALFDLNEARKNSRDFKSSHFDEPNIITHLRMNTRTDADGKKVLFLEEVQSDWGQKGKREGFAVTDAQRRRKEILSKEALSREELAELDTLGTEYKVPSAPYVTNTNAWVKLGLKVALKEAINQGVDRIAWTTGEQQNERYDLSKQVDEIRARKNEDGTYKINAAKDGSNIFAEDRVEANRLPDIVGKDLAERIVNDKSNEGKFTQYKGQDLKVGGKGMKAFYGDAQTPGIVANVAKALVKELTGKEGSIIKSAVLKGESSNLGLAFDNGKWIAIDNSGKTQFESSDRKDVLDFIKGNRISQPAIEITPELRQEVQAGMPQFSKGSRMESSKDFKLAAFVMREKADGAPMSEIVSGIASVFPNMSPQEIKDLVDDPETWLRNKYANLSKAMQDNLIARARVKNIYAPRTGAVAPAFQGLEVPMSKIEEATQAPTFKERVDKVFTNFKNKFIDPAKGLPDWIISLKDFAGGTKQIEISRAELTIRQLKEVAKKIGFTDWDTFAAALKSIPQPIQQPVGSGAGMVAFNPSVAAAGAPYTIPNSLLPQTTPPAVQALPLEIIPFVYKMRGQIDGLTKDLIASGYVTPEQAAKLESNIGQYVNRAYRLYNEKGWRPDQDQIRETTKFLADQYIKQLATDNAGVLTYEQVEKQAIEKAKRDVNEILDKKTNPYFAAKSESRNMGILKERKDIPEPIRKLMGEYTDPGTVFIMTVAKQAALKASSEYLTKVRNMGMGTLFFEENDPNRPASASVQIAAEGSDTKSPLNGLYTMPEVAEAMETVNPTYNEVVNLWMKAVGAVRWGKTVGSVKTQLLNFESNLGFAVMNGLLMTGATGKAFNASRKYVAGQYSNKELSDITQKVIQLGLVGQGVNATELAKMLGSGDIHDIALDLAVNPDSKYRMAKKAPGKALGVLNKLYRMGDDFWKVYAYMNERELVAGAMFDKKYADLTDQEQADVDIESSERVKSTWPTYDRVFPAVKAISQNTPIFGNFISFRAESIRVLANTIAMAIKDMKTPGFEGIGARRMAGILSYIAIRTGATYAFAQAVGMAASGLTGLLFGRDDEEERKKRAFKQAAPSFMATQDIAVIPTKDKHRFVVYSLSGIDPYNTTFNTLNALTDGTATKEPGPAAAFAEFFGGFLSPEMTFNTVWSIITNTDPKSGNRIVGKTDEGADAYAKIGAYLFDELKPSTISMVQRLAGDNPSAELASLVGARPYEIDLHKSFSFALSDMARQMKEINDEYSFVQFNKKATEDEKALAQKEAEQKKALLIERMNQRFNDFVLIGANPEELRKLIFDRSPIKTTGFDQQTKFGIINGNVNKELLFK